MNPSQSTLQCSNCGTPNPVAMRRVINAQNDPQGKAALLSGSINQFRCQACGTLNTVSSPLLYHDGSKELLIAFVPMDVALRQGLSEDKMVGDLMNELTRTIPKEQFRAYMFNPKRALTMKGLIEQILEADGITKEMLEDQQKRVMLVQKFLEAKSEEDLIKMIQENDAEINMTTFQTLSLMAQRLVQQGQQQVVAHLAAVQQVLLENSSFGKELEERNAAQEDKIREVAADIEALGEDPQRADFLNLVLSYIDDEDKLSALVGLVRPAFDSEFFNMLTTHIGKAPAAEREKLEELRTALSELTQAIDQQSRALVQQKAQFLQILLGSPEYQQLLAENADQIDDNFMAVLTANVQEAEKRGEVQVAAKLKQIYQASVAILQSQMSPELQFLNVLLSAPDDATMQALVKEQAGNFDGELLETLDAVEQMFASQGQEAALSRLSQIREALQAALS
jgi:hypothetical protein